MKKIILGKNPQDCINEDKQINFTEVNVSVNAPCIEQEEKQTNNNVTICNNECEEECTCYDREEILYEDKKKRSENAQFFVNNDNTTRAVFTSHAKHYFDKSSNEYKKINNKLEDKGEFLENKANSFKARFNKKLSNGKIYELEKENSKVSLLLSNIEHNDCCTIENCNCDSDTHSEVLVKNVAENVDIQYIVEPDRVKENIIVKQKQDNYIFDFNISIDNLEPKLSSDGKRLELKNKTTNEIDYTIPTPFMFDNNQVYCNDVYYEIGQETDSILTLKVVVSEEFMNAEDRAYPVTIDPQIVLNDSKIFSCENYSSDNSSSSSGTQLSSWNKVNYDHLMIGNTGQELFKSYLKIDKTSLGILDEKISNVTLKVYPSYLLNSYESEYVPCYVNNTRYTFYGGGYERIGLTQMFKESDEECVVVFEPYLGIGSKIHIDVEGNNSPILEIEYIADIGPTTKTFLLADSVILESDLSTPETVMSFNDYSSDKAVLKYEISHVYKKTSNDYGLGKNFRLSLHERLDNITDSLLHSNYTHTDSNGYKYHFTDKYYYLDKNNKKEYINKKDIIVDLDGILWYANNKVKKEHITASGLKAIVEINNFTNSKFLEQRQEQIIELVEKKDAYSNKLKDTVIVNIGSSSTCGNIIDTFGENLSKEKYYEFINKVEQNGVLIDSAMVMTKSEAIQYKSLLLQQTSVASIKNSGLQISSSYSVNKDYSDSNIKDKKFTKSYTTYIADLRKLVNDLKSDYTTLLRKSDYASSAHISANNSEPGAALNYQFDEYIDYLSSHNYKSNNDMCCLDITGVSSEEKLTNIRDEGDTKNHLIINYRHLKNNYCDLKAEYECISDDLDSYNRNKNTDKSLIAELVAQKVIEQRLRVFERNFAQRVEKLKTNIEMFEQEINIAVNEAQSKLIDLQIDDILSRKNFNYEQLQKVYKAYINTDYQLGQMKKQMPVNYLTDGKVIKGFNEYGQLVAIYDNYKNSIVIEYDKNDRIVKVYENESKVNIFDYNSNDLLSSVTDTQGKQTKYEYDTNARLIKVQYCDGKIIDFTYDGSDNINSVKSSNGFYSTIETNKSYIDIKNYSTVSRISNNAVVNSPINQMISEYSISYTTYYPTTVSDKNGIVEYYHFNNEGRNTAYYLEENSKVVKAEKYEYVRYQKDKVTMAKKDTLNKTSYNNFSFVVGDYQDTILDEFNNPVSTSTKTKVISVDSNNQETTSKTITTYFYDNDQRCEKERTEIRIITPVNTEIYYAVTQYFYNTNNEVIRIEKYIEGEEYLKGKDIEETVFDKNGNIIKSVKYNSLNSSAKFYTENESSENGQVKSEFDESGENKVTYTYVNDTNIVNSTIDSNGSVLSYGYDNSGALTSITSSNDNGQENSTQTQYTLGQVTELRSGNNTINYEYDYKLRTIAVKLNSNKNYLSIAYDDDITYNNVICDKTTITNINGDVFESYTDKKGNALSMSHNGVIQVVSEYDVDNKLTKFTDKISNEITTNTYDSLDRITAVAKTGINPVTEIYNYNNYGNISKRTVSSSVNHEYSYGYKNNASKDLDNIVFKNNNKQVAVFTTTQDAMSRLKNKTIANINGKLLGEYYYYKQVGDHATNLVSGVRYGEIRNGNYMIGDGLTYAYDKSNNISKIYEKGNLQVSYIYDKLNRIIREDNLQLNKTCFFTYDNNGNILTNTQTVYTQKSLQEIDFQDLTTTEYLYSEVGDMLLSYDNLDFKYDLLGNPTLYKDKKVEWTKGRQMKSYDNFTYTYDGQGRRVSKTLNDKTLSYIYDNNGKLLKQSDGLEFIYDNSGVIGIVYNYTEYFYRKNAQGDIIALVDNTGSVVVKYVYDAWGNHKVFAVDAANKYHDITDTTKQTTISVMTSQSYVGDDVFVGEDIVLSNYLSDSIIQNATHIGNINPIRYRGYYYDAETAIFYCASRYYDPKVGRWLNADDIDFAMLQRDMINGLNLYSYCMNNPISFSDPSGHSILLTLLLGVLIGSAVGFTSSVVTQLVTYGEINWNVVLLDTAIGAISGLIGASPIGVLGQMGLGGFVSLINYMGTQAIRGEEITGLGALSSFGIGAIFNAGNSGALHGSMPGKKILKTTFVKQMGKETSKRISKDGFKAGLKYFGKHVINKLWKDFVWDSASTGIMIAGINIGGYWLNKIQELY